ncbi:hypothetical protein [Arthrobacter sp. efr-133-TYG-118]|uniref:hypothetical protein n=1 Tax=Arthrobacter sp. efr-133-TYG-118 TaxID=3040279 RepID=UPI00254C898F|nr:hypothetical protein [Arthrobacter sp. efr-133-TYG-118]
MNLSLNDAQLLVLQWVAEGGDLENPPNDTFKTSAVALDSRGLVALDKRRGRWSIAITDTGTFYLEHGHHPKAEASTPKEPARQKPERKGRFVKEVTTDVNSDQNAEPETPAKPERIVKDETIPMPDQVRRPHKALREIIDHKARLDVQTGQRQRALLILHALAQEATRRGWDVIATPSTFEVDQWTGRRARVYPGPDLLSIDAGDAPAAIRLKMQQKRVAHVPTEKELADKARNNWQSYPKYDYVPTERMRLEIRASSYEVLTLDDTVATRIEDKLLRAIEKVEQMSVDARKAAERRRQMDIERLEEQRRAQELRNRAARYGSWLKTLEQLRDEFVRHRELAEVVAGLREAVEQRGTKHEYAEILGEYLEWSKTHLEESDPFRRILLPQGERPDLSFDEWRDWKRQHPQNW